MPVGPQSRSSSLDLLPVLDYVPVRWQVSRNHDAVTIRQADNVVAIPAAELTQFLAALDRLAG